MKAKYRFLKEYAKSGMTVERAYRKIAQTSNWVKRYKRRKKILKELIEEGMLEPWEDAHLYNITEKGKKKVEEVKQDVG